MKKRTGKYKSCGRRAAAMAGIAAMLSGIPAQAVWAVGPGEGNVTSGAVGNPGPGGSASGNSSSQGGASYGPGGPGVSGGQGSTGGGSSSGTAAVNPNAWKRSGRDYLMPDGSSITGVFRRGIDVSRWQGEVNWSQVAADDVSFVMLGTRSKGEEIGRAHV